MGIIQKWLTLMTGLAAGALVLANPDAVVKVAGGVKNLVGGTATQIATSGKRG